MKKPRITKPRLIWREVKGVWVPSHRSTWTENGKTKAREITLKWEGDPMLLDRLYWECENGRHEKQQTQASKYTWEALIDAWRNDPRGQGKLTEATAKRYRPVMEHILSKNGSKNVRRTTRQGLRAAHAKLEANPRKADYYVGTIKMLWNYAVKRLDWPLGNNPAEGLELYGTQSAFKAWPEWMIKKLADAPPEIALAAELIICTGQRPSAAITMKWSQFSEEWMIVRDEKAGVEFEVYCPERLRAALAEASRKGAHVLAKNLTEPMGYGAIEHRFRRWRKGLGDKAKPFSLHGLRKLAVVQLAEAGCSDAEIQAVTGQSAETVAYYRNQANRKRLSKTAQEKRR